MTAFYHTPVLLEKVLSLLSVKKGCWYIDGTLGGGGYSLAIVDKGGKIIGIDRDTDAIAYARARFHREIPEKKEGKDWIIVHDNFRHIETIAQKLNVTIQGIVLDLGVSSYQLENKERGFSYRCEDGQLDMRMNKTEGIPASTIINTYSKEELYDIFARYGEEKRAWAIAHAIVLARRIKRLTTVKDLVNVIKPLGGERDRTLARVFQALRIAVNDELGSLKEGLQGAERILPAGGKLVVVSFHSLEDRYVKQLFQRPAWKKLTGVVTPDEKEFCFNFL